MLNRSLAVLLLVAATLIPGPARAAVDLTMRTGTSRILHFRDIKQIAIGDATIVGALPLPGKAEVLVNAKQPGRTTLFIWTSDGVEHDYQVTVTASELDLLAAMLKSTISRSDVSVETFGHSIVLRGTVPDGSALQGVTDVLARFEPVAKQDNAVVVNAVMIAHPLGGLQSGPNGNPYMRTVRVDPDGQGNVIVSGRVLNEEQRQSVLNDVRGMSGRYLSSKGQILDRLAMTLTTQVDVKVYILEIDDTGLSTLGTRLQNGTPTSQGQLVLGPASFPITEAKPAFGPRNAFQPFALGPFFRTTVLAPTIDLMMTQGHAKMLSAPDLTTVPGQAATFLVGGQIPVPQSGGLGAVSVSYQNYGVQLNVTPTLLGNGDVATQISPEVSDLDFQDGVTLNGFVIPALKTSRISTNVITAPGESIIMGGMLRRIEARNIERIPLLSSLPIIGRLFQDVRYQRGETNIVFIMTPTVITR
ncbi:MAG: pilus assembly protein N-terminal domain-containing protein [Candidatus Eremiobacteraeota bacterium]|nr:pilus assembly protein N-terminal domain-containing protein [Candidatus Eremiobacteraeota bacterium]